MGHEKILWLVDRGSKRNGKWRSFVFRTKKAAEAWKQKQNPKHWITSSVGRAEWGPDNV